MTTLRKQLEALARDNDFKLPVLPALLPTAGEIRDSGSACDSGWAEATDKVPGSESYDFVGRLPEVIAKLTSSEQEWLLAELASMGDRWLDPLLRALAVLVVVGIDDKKPNLTEHAQNRLLQTTRAWAVFYLQTPRGDWPKHLQKAIRTTLYNAYCTLPNDLDDFPDTLRDLYVTYAGNCGRLLDTIGAKRVAKVFEALTETAPKAEKAKERPKKGKVLT